MKIIEKVVDHATRVRTGPGPATFGQHPEYHRNQSIVRIVLLGIVAGALALIWAFWSS